MKEGKNGVTANTPDNILFGAGTIHRGLKYSNGSWNFKESLMGATSGGSKFSIVPEITNLEVDGALVRTKGLSIKTGETATMEINFAELTEDIIKMSVIGRDGTSEDATYDLIESKANIEEGDYLENIAFVGKTATGKNIIAIMDNALCTSGMEQEGKNKEGAVGKYTFECSAELTDDSELDTLPWHIYYPKGGPSKSSDSNTVETGTMQLDLEGTVADTVSGIVSEMEEA